MPSKKVFIDGAAGTTGLRIHERLAAREDIALLTLSDAERKDPAARARMLNSCDIAFLCLPDDAAREAVAMIENPDVTVIDASTAHRTSPSFAYGFPELSDAHRQGVKTCRRIAVPGCHASGVISLVYPLIKAGILPADAHLAVHSLTGYSGGGKKMIADYESEGRDPLLSAPRQYGITQAHKHLPEIGYVTGLEVLPAFCPIVADFYSGMLVTVPLHAKDLNGGIEDIRKVYEKTYTGPVVKYLPDTDEGGFLSAAAKSGLDSMEISVFGNDDRILLVARYDNLGKGASGAALQCMNIAIGADETLGLILEA